MKRIFAIAILCFSLYSTLWAAEPVQLAMSPAVLGGSGGASASLTCQAGTGDNWTNIETGDYSGLSTTEDYNGQQVANGAAKSICKIVCRLDNPGINTNSTIKVKSDYGGSTYGTSDTAVIPADASGTPVEYNFTTDAEVPASNFVFVITPAGAGTSVKLSATEAKYFGGADYDAKVNNVAQTTDMSCTIWYKQ